MEEKQGAKPSPNRDAAQISVNIQAIVDKLLVDTRASRVTLRQPALDGKFRVSHEALASGVSSIRAMVSPNQRSQPVVRQVLLGKQVVQNDSLSASADEDFQTLLELYGGLRAQIVTPVMIEDQVRGILSLHQLGEPREWTAGEAECCRRTATALAKALPKEGQ
jgi:GAF domain-containing protein